MPRTVIRSVLAIALIAGATSEALAQTLPTSQPPLMVIYREQIKPGHDAAHAKTESGWPAAFAAAGSPDYYLAMASMTGPSEVWFTTPWDSFILRGQAMARDEANPTLTAALERLSTADAEHLAGYDVIEAMAAPELSHGAFPNLNTSRFWNVTRIRIRPGHEPQLVDAMNAYKAASSRADPSASWRVYQVTHGMPGGTYLVYSSVEFFSQFDDILAGDQAVNAALTERERQQLQTFSAEGLRTVVTNRFRLDPGMSYVSEETKAMDPQFWKINR